MKAHASAAVVPAVAMLLAWLLGYAISYLLSRDRYKAALITSLWLFLVTAFGPVSTSINAWVLFGIPLAKPTVLLTVWGLALLAGTLAILRTRADLRPLNRLAIVVGAGLFVVPLWTIARFEVTSNRTATTVNCTYSDDMDFASAIPDSAPDIYFICLDRYASNSSLRDYFDYDNSAFTDHLSSRGFYVAQESYSNYVMTLQSLSATLSMRYIDCLTSLMGNDSVNRLPLFFMLEDYRVWRFLKAKGYLFIHAGTRFHVTAHNPNADINYNVEQLPEFTRMYLETTMAAPVLSKLRVLDDNRAEKYKRVNHNFARLMAVPDTPGPKFVFGHFLIPHEPYVFDSNGGFVDSDAEAARSARDNYVGQLEYTNKRVLELVDAILQKSRKPPVIIVQSDEGPYPAGTKAAEFKWESATRDECREKTRILNAMYLPGIDPAVFHPSMTPVNTFRLVFNQYFGTNYEILPDECFAYYDLFHLYRFVPITDRVR